MVVGRRSHGLIRGCLRLRGRGRGQCLAARQPHCDDFLLLLDHDFLGDTAQLFVLAMPEFRKRHVDGALVVRNHHRCKIGVDVAGRLDGHVGHHLVHRGGVLGQERCFVGGSSLCVQAHYACKIQCDREDQQRSFRRGL